MLYQWSSSLWPWSYSISHLPKHIVLTVWHNTWKFQSWTDNQNQKNRQVTSQYNHNVIGAFLINLYENMNIKFLWQDWQMLLSLIPWTILVHKNCSLFRMYSVWAYKVAVYPVCLNNMKCLRWFQQQRRLVWHLI